MQTFLAWLAFLGFLPLIVKATAKGTLSPGAAAVLAVVIVVAVRVVGVRRFYSRVVLPVVGVVLVAAQYSHGDMDSFWAILSGLLTLSLMMVGFYLMIAGFFRGCVHDHLRVQRLRFPILLQMRRPAVSGVWLEKTEWGGVMLREMSETLGLNVRLRQAHSAARAVPIAVGAAGWGVSRI